MTEVIHRRHRVNLVSPVDLHSTYRNLGRLRDRLPTPYETKNVPSHNQANDSPTQKNQAQIVLLTGDN